MADPMSPADVLRRAADHCDEVGLHQGLLWPGANALDPYRPGDPCCLLGHIAVAMGHSQSTSLPYGVIHLGEVVRAGLPPDAVSVTRWSDTPGRTAAEVSAVLRAAAERAES